ncbi:MAG: hypothetical protein E6Q97_23785 [Desulfurellales bacterium]|nr:MAG: hypothetical protein E6Q97_23785 [Desulfurellales bacterium]
MPRYLFPPFAARLMIDYAPVSKPTLTKRDLDIRTFRGTHKRSVLTLLGFTRRYQWGLQAGNRVRARHATPQEIELGHAALVRSSYGCAVGRRYWRLDPEPNVGGTLWVMAPTPDGEIWYSVGEIRLNVGEPLPEVRERVKSFLREIQPIPRS